MGVAIALVVAFAVTVPSGHPLAACLNGQLSVEQEYERSSLVFVGRVIAARAVPEKKSFYEGTQYTIRVGQTIRGRPRHTISVFSENSGGRFPMNVGIDYLVFLSRGIREPPMVDNCGNSGPLPEKAVALDTVRNLGQQER